MSKSKKLLFFSFLFCNCLNCAVPGSALAKERKVDMKALEQRAFSGNPQAQYALAKAYEDGSGGFKQDLSYAISWYEEAAHNGLKIASEKLKSLSMEK